MHIRPRDILLSIFTRVFLTISFLSVHLIHVAPPLPFPWTCPLFPVYLKAIIEAADTKETNDHTPYLKIVLCRIISAVRKCQGALSFSQHIVSENLWHTSEEY